MTQTLTSVGIDIGTTTTQLVFCKILVENMATAWTVPSIRIVDKTVTYKSDIHFTPMINHNTLDSEGIRRIIRQEYEKAGMTPVDVSTGAVIITGEAARKENAEDVLNMLGGLAGNFVVTTAGPDLEGILAGKGSGACSYSEEHCQTILNFDIGGGTTNAAVFKNGDVVDSACFDIGGRLIKIDSNSNITYMSKKMVSLIKHLGLDIKIGDVFRADRLEKITDAMANALVDIGKGNSDDAISRLLVTDHGLATTHKIDYISLSGGVADLIETNESNLIKYGDIGILLGRSLKKALLRSGLKMFIAKETIRATVIGAGVHTTNISGSTINFDSHLLPLKNIPIIRLSQDEENHIGDLRSTAIRRKLDWVIHEGIVPLVALSLKGSRSYGFDDLQLLADDILEGMKRTTDAGQPLVVVVDHDIGKSLGLSLRRNLSQDYPLICIDSVIVDNGDYIDVGTPIAGGQVLPVVIKTLLFGY